MAKAEDPSMSTLLRAAIEDVRELARAEGALVKAELEAGGISLLVGLATFTAAAVLIAIGLAMLVALAVLTWGGTATGALGAATAALMSVCAVGVCVSVRLLPMRRSPDRQPLAGKSASW